MPNRYLFANNRAWAEARLRDDPRFFERLCDIQRPDHMWIGCADSRVPANEIVGLAPGEMFVHRNVANVVAGDDVNGMSVLQYAVDILQVKHVIVCGHYGCGGVQAALGPAQPRPLEDWLSHIRSVRDAHAGELDALRDERARWDRLCELNVITQVRIARDLPTVQRAWERGQPLTLHGWIYDLHDGLLRDLGCGTAGPATTATTPDAAT